MLIWRLISFTGSCGVAFAVLVFFCGEQLIMIRARLRGINILYGFIFTGVQLHCQKGVNNDHISRKGAKTEFYVGLLAAGESFLALNQIISPGNITAKEINISIELPLNDFITIPRMNKIKPAIINTVPAVL
jgi:hypothetical protein